MHTMHGVVDVRAVVLGSQHQQLAAWERVQPPPYMQHVQAHVQTHFLKWEAHVSVRMHRVKLETHVRVRVADGNGKRTSAHTCTDWN